MLRLYLAQQCIGLSDEGVEDAIYDSQAMRRFVGIDLAEKGLLLREGTIVDATLIAAPPSVKNRDKKRDPAMHQTKKGNQWHFGMKAHIGVDAESGLVHTVVGTAANVHDVTQAHALLHGEEKTVHGDAGYVGVEKRPENVQRTVGWNVAMRPGRRKRLPDTVLGRALDKLEQVKARIRAKVEHPFHWVKNLFKHRKVRYRGLEKNTAQLHTLFGLANLFIAKRRLLALEGGVRPNGGGLRQKVPDVGENRSKAVFLKFKLRNF